jgi:hypothetical protein
MIKTILTIGIFAFGLSATTAVAQQSDRVIAAKIKAAKDAVTVSCGGDTTPRTITYSEKMDGVVSVNHFSDGSSYPEVFASGHSISKASIGVHLLGFEDQVDFTESAVTFDNGSISYVLDKHALTLRVVAPFENATYQCDEKSH